jgi:hypothetical protein
MRTQAELLAGPDRPCDWRHHRARRLNEAGRLPSPMLDDDTTRTLAEFYQLHRRCRTDFDYRRLYRRMPSVSAAYRLFKDGRGGTREIVESMVLAREEASDIASLVGMTPDAIRFFEDAYFDVRSRINMRDFILNQVIEIHRKPRSEEEFLFKALKFYGYVAGPRSLEVFQFYAGPPIRWQHMGEVLRGIELRARALMQFEAVGPIGQMSRQATRELIKLLEWNREPDGGFGDEDDSRTPTELRWERMTRKMMESMP